MDSGLAPKRARPGMTRLRDCCWSVSGTDEILVVASDLGDRLKINNSYPSIVTTYARDFLINAAAEAHRLYARGDLTKEA